MFQGHFCGKCQWVYRDWNLGEDEDTGCSPPERGKWPGPASKELMPGHFCSKSGTSVLPKSLIINQIIPFGSRYMQIPRGAHGYPMSI